MVLDDGHAVGVGPAPREAHRQEAGLVVEADAREPPGDQPAAAGEELVHLGLGRRDHRRVAQVGGDEEDVVVIELEPGVHVGLRDLIDVEAEVREHEVLFAPHRAGDLDVPHRLRAGRHRGRREVEPPLLGEAPNLVPRRVGDVDVPVVGPHQ